MPEPFTITMPPDSGNIEVVRASDTEDVRLRIRPDGRAAFHQWFYFRIGGVAGRRLRMVIENAGESSYPQGWEGYRAVASEDGERWVRVPTSYEDGHLMIEHTPTRGVCEFAYFAPYPARRNARLIARSLASPFAAFLPLGLSVDGQPIEGLRIGEPGPAKRQLWVIGRQHPGESMGSWWMEGFLPRLLDPEDEDARALRAGAVVTVVPMMNPDGVRRGHLRTNAAGTDLNRAWAAPSPETSPEVLAVRRAMEKAGCDLFLDVHGDEIIPETFIAGAEGVPGWTDRLAELKRGFQHALLARTRDFQTERGYGIPPVGKANIKIATNWVGDRFDCLSATLEMPFKDAGSNPDETYGFSPGRCAALGEACLGTMAEMLPRLR